MMRLISFLLMAAELLSVCSAYPALASTKLEERATAPAHAWIPVQPGGIRAPCPGSNTLANHGYINRNGKNITRAMYQRGFLQGFGISVPETVKLMNVVFKNCQNMFNGGLPCTSINLDMLNVPHSVEHDGSLTRDDYYTAWNPNGGGDNHSFNQSVWDRTQEIISSVVGPVTHLNVQTANTMRLRRVEQAQIVDGSHFLERDSPSLGEHAFYLSTMNDPALGHDRMTDPRARLDWVNHWFVNEELPTALGWTRNPTAITNLPALQSIIAAQPTIPAASATTTSSGFATSTTTTTPTVASTSTDTATPTNTSSPSETPVSGS